MPVPGSAAESRAVPEGALNLMGSFMIYNYDNIDQVWARIKSDPYWDANVWDREKLAVWPLLS